MATQAERIGDLSQLPPIEAEAVHLENHAEVVPIRPGLGIEITPVVESPRVLRPSDIFTYVYQDPDDKSLAPLTVFKPAWTGADGNHEPKVEAKARLYPSHPANMVKVTKIGRPSFWGEDERPREDQLEEYQIGLAEAIRVMMDPEQLNPFAQDRYTPPTQIEFLNLSGIAAEALLTLQMPWEHRTDYQLGYDGAGFGFVTPYEAVRGGSILSASLTFDREHITTQS